MAWAPFSVTSNGRIRNLEMKLEDSRLRERMYALEMIETGFAKRTRDVPAYEHAKVLKKTFDLMTSSQMEAFRVEKEPEEVKERYGTDGFGQGCLLARRLVEAGVPFVEVDLGGWDNHNGIHNILKDTKLPQLDRAMSALMEDLEQRELIKDTVVIWMGEFGRTPGDGNGHFCRAWTSALAGGGIKTGQVVGKTSEGGSKPGHDVVERPISAPDFIATLCTILGIDTHQEFIAAGNRPMPMIDKSAKVVTEIL